MSKWHLSLESPPLCASGGDYRVEMVYWNWPSPSELHHPSVNAKSKIVNFPDGRVYVPLSLELCWRTVDHSSATYGVGDHHPALSRGGHNPQLYNIFIAPSGSGRGDMWFWYQQLSWIPPAINNIIITQDFCYQGKLFLPLRRGRGYIRISRSSCIWFWEGSLFTNRIHYFFSVDLFWISW